MASREKEHGGIGPLGVTQMEKRPLREHKERAGMEAPEVASVGPGREASPIRTPAHGLPDQTA